MSVKYRPSPFVPNTSFSGEEPSLLIAGENMWIHYGRDTATVYATGYKGSTDLSETISTKTLTGTLAYSTSTRTVTGTSTLFLTELHLGEYILADGGAGAGVLLVVEKIVSNLSFIATSVPDLTASGKTGYVLPVIDSIGTDRVTMVRGKVIQFPKGHYLGVGDGEVKINGASLFSAFNLSKTPRFALYNPTANTYLQDDVGITLPSPVAPATTTITTVAVTPSPVSQMVAGLYMIRVCASNTETLGYSQPSDTIAPVTLTAGQAIQITFNCNMAADQNAWDIYGTPFKDSGTTTIETAYMGPWFFIETVTDVQLASRSAGSTRTVSYSDAEIQLSTGILTFDNFAPKDAEFVDMVNGVPFYFSCLGRGNAGAIEGTSPGPVAIPSKPLNPEAVLLDRALTTAQADTIIGEYNVKARNYVLCQNSLQTLIETTLDQNPVTFRSLWNTGFRNPYNAAFIKDYIYAFSAGKIVRSVAGGDDSTIEFDFESDIRNYIGSWDTGKVLVCEDPQNRAVCFFLSAAERRSGYWVTIVLPFLLDKQVFNPPIVLSKANTDFIVSGVAKVGANLEFLAGGRTSGGSVVVKTYRFDGGDSDTKHWFLAWAYSDDGEELRPKTINGVAVTGRFASVNTRLDIYGVMPEGEFKLADLQAGTNPNNSMVIGQKANFGRKRLKLMDAAPYSLYTARFSGSYTGSTVDTVDRLDEIVLKTNTNNSET